MLPLRDGDGKPVNGLLNPLTHASTEQPVDLSGKTLEQRRAGSRPRAAGPQGLAMNLALILCHVESAGRGGGAGKPPVFRDLPRVGPVTTG